MSSRITVVEKQKDYFCSFDNCSKTFSRRDKLRDHINAHTNERMYPCKEEGCGRSYLRANHLKRHLLSHFPNSAAPAERIRCSHETCTQTFSTNQNLKKHLERVHNADRYKCSIEGCKEQFRKMHQLKAHSFTHLGVLPFQCHHSDCLKRFDNKGHLVRHLKTHEGYPCPEAGCSEVSKNWSLLRKHKATVHPTEHTCQVCSKVFTHRGQYNQHRETHEERTEAYTCPYDFCDRSYHQKRNLKAHVTSYHKGNTFICDSPGCHKQLKTRRSLLHHQTQHDPNRPRKEKKSRKGIPKKPILEKLNEFIVSSETHFHLEPSSKRQEQGREQDQPEIALVDTSSQDRVLGACHVWKKRRWRTSFAGVQTTSMEDMEISKVADHEAAGSPQRYISSEIDQPVKCNSTNDSNGKQAQNESEDLSMSDSRRLPIVSSTFPLIHSDDDSILSDSSCSSSAGSDAPSETIVSGKLSEMEERTTKECDGMDTEHVTAESQELDDAHGESVSVTGQDHELTEGQVPTEQAADSESLFVPSASGGLVERVKQIPSNELNNLQSADERLKERQVKTAQTPDSVLLGVASADEKLVNGQTEPDTASGHGLDTLPNVGEEPMEVQVSMEQALGNETVTEAQENTAQVIDNELLSMQDVDERRTEEQVTTRQVSSSELLDVQNVNEELTDVQVTSQQISSSELPSVSTDGKPQDGQVKTGQASSSEVSSLHSEHEEPNEVQVTAKDPLSTLNNNDKCITPSDEVIDKKFVYMPTVTVSTNSTNTEQVMESVGTETETSVKLCADATSGEHSSRTSKPRTTLVSSLDEIISTFSGKKKNAVAK